MRALVALTCILASAVWPYAASAQPVGGLIVIPHPASRIGLSYFKLAARPGRSQIAGTIELRNTTARALSVRVTAVDGRTLDTLGSSYVSASTPAHGPTLWLRLSRRTVTVGPGGRAVVAVSVRVPRRAATGDYLTGVSIEALHQHARDLQQGGVTTASTLRYAIGVEVSLPGPRHPLIRFTGARLESRPAGLTFLLDARNSGNVILPGVYGRVRIARGGHVVLSRSIAAGTFLAGTAISYPLPAFGQRPAEGTRYSISAWMRYHGGIARLQTSLTFGEHDAIAQASYSTPARAGTHGGTAWWKTAMLVAAILYGACTTVVLLRRRSRERARAAADAGPKRDETLRPRVGPGR
jgi:hypothetical protein